MELGRDGYGRNHSPRTQSMSGRRICPRQRADFGASQAMGRRRMLLDHGIDVWTTMNLQHLRKSERLRSCKFAGIRVRETVPDWVVKQANEVVVVDVTPEALRNRLNAASVYGIREGGSSSGKFLRNRLCCPARAHLSSGCAELEARHSEFAPASIGSAPPPVEQRASERILIHITSDPATAMPSAADTESRSTFAPIALPYMFRAALILWIFGE